MSDKEDKSAGNEHRNVKCPKCDTVQSATHKKCSSCGHDLKQAIKAKFAKLSFDPVEYRYQLLLAKDSLAKASTPEPWGKPGGPGLWKHKGMHLPYYIQHVSHGIFRSNPAMGQSRAIEIAVGKVRDWAEGKGDVDAGTQAASRKAIAEWEATRAQAHAKSAA